MLNLPNSITLSRIILVIVYTVALAVDGSVSPFINEVTGHWFQPISMTACIALWAFVIAAKASALVMIVLAELVNKLAGPELLDSFSLYIPMILNS